MLQLRPGTARKRGGRGEKDAWALSVSIYTTAWKPTIANIFSYRIGYFYILLTVSFAVQKLFSLMLSHLFIFVLVASAFGFLSPQKITAKTSVSKLVLII